MMEKISRSRSTDQLQENLREEKSIWNHSVSKLIAELIALKQGMNGYGNAEAGLPPSDIKDPLPSEIASYLNQLAGEYNSIIQGANHIFQNQDNYSKNRRKSLPHQESTQPQQEMSFVDDGLTSQASWWGSRLWA